jgi:hypothetical protein
MNYEACKSKLATFTTIRMLAEEKSDEPVEISPF